MTRNEKDKTRWITIRFIERHCNIEKTCQVCGEEDAQIHHIDYTNPYLINLLCKQCHIKLHKNEIAQQAIINIKNAPYYVESKSVITKAKPIAVKIKAYSPWENFGSELKHQRKLKNLSIQKLSDLSGVSKSYLDYLERGKRLPSVFIIKSLVNALEISYHSLLNSLIIDYRIALKEGNNE